jgi:tellurite methyltransferase
MSIDDRRRWDQQHVPDHRLQQPATFLKRVFESGKWPLPVGHALDVACGKGRNAVYLAEHGFAVHAIDISPVALAYAQRLAAKKCLSIVWEATDLEQARLPLERYDLVVNLNYLQRSLIPQLKQSLKPGGLMIFETYLIDQQHLGHPKNPEYLLLHNELLEQFRGYRVLLYREGKILEESEAAFRAGILAQKCT